MDEILKTACAETIKDSSFKVYKKTSIKLFNIINDKNFFNEDMNGEDIMKGFGKVINKFEDLKKYLEKNNLKNTTKKNYINNLLNIILKINNIDNYCIKNKKKLETIKLNIKNYWMELREIVEEKNKENKQKKLVYEKILEYSQFHPLKNYEEWYEISKAGEVRNMNYKTTLKANTNNKAGKMRITLVNPQTRKKNIKYIHVLVAEQFLEKPSNTDCNYVVEHIDKDPLNNKLCNLRWITMNEVNRNKTPVDKTNTTSKYVGVHYDKKTDKWVASIRIQGKKTYLGSFEDEEEASIEYKNKLEMIMSIFEKDETTETTPLSA